jgi:hypothetical protein
MWNRITSRLSSLALLLSSLLLAGTGLIAKGPPLAGHSQDEEKTVEEIVANLAAGRVIIGVFKDGLVIGTIESKLEPSSVPPPIVPITSVRAGVLLGAAEWVSPSSHQVVVNLAHDLPHVRGNAPLSTQQPHLAQTIDTRTASDIEQTGLGLMNRLNDGASQLHAQLDIPHDEPLTELILAGFVPSYGPEVWFLTYTIEQEPERGDFWTTRVHRPRYVQYWPPEKKEPRTLIEFDYPDEPKTIKLRDLILAHDPRLEKIRSTSPDLASVADAILRGDTDKTFVASGEAYLGASMDAIAEGNHERLAVIHFDSGFQWVIAPPPETQTQKAERPEGAPTLERPPDAPTLQKPPQ